LASSGRLDVDVGEERMAGDEPWVFLAAMTPAICGSRGRRLCPPGWIRASVSGFMRTLAEATARRAVSALAEMSTMRGRPAAST
jgi:hypothetical protein